VNFSFMQSTPRCIAPVSPYALYALRMFVPFILIAELWFGAALHLALHRALGRGGAATRITGQFKALFAAEFAVHKYVRTTMSLLAFSYLQVSSTALEFLNCVPYAEHSLLAAAPAVDCASDTYRAYRPLAITMLTVVGALFPLALTGFLYRNRELMGDATSGFAVYYGTFFEKYRTDAWFWAAVGFARNLLVVGLGVRFYLDSAARFLAFSYTNMAMLGATWQIQPHRNVAENAMDIVAQWLLLVTSVYFAGIPPPYTSASAAFVGAMVVPFAVVGTMIVIALRIPSMRIQALAVRFRFREPPRRATVPEAVAGLLGGAAAKGAAARADDEEVQLTPNPAYTADGDLSFL
jgi:hypothetical protein